MNTQSVKENAVEQQPLGIIPAWKQAIALVIANNLMFLLIILIIFGSETTQRDYVASE